MLPPSPQTYQPRFPNHLSFSNGGTPQNMTRDLPPPQHRPSSSMSISSMLGSEHDHPSRDQNPPVITAGAATNFSSKPASEMSPPHPAVRSSPGKSYEPGTQTPDRMGISNLLGPRPYRSGSGSIMQGSRPSEDTVRAASRTIFPPFRDIGQQVSGQEGARGSEESPHHIRRTSISGILQRPSSQPEPQAHGNFPGPRLQPVNYPQQAIRPGWSIPRLQAQRISIHHLRKLRIPAEPRIMVEICKMDTMALL